MKKSVFLFLSFTVSFIGILNAYGNIIDKITYVPEKVIYANPQKDILKQCKNVATKKTTPIVDLRADFGAIRDQDSFGFCFGFAAADLLYQHARYNSDIFDPPKKVKSIVDSEVFSAASMTGNFYRYVDMVTAGDGTDEVFFPEIPVELPKTSGGEFKVVGKMRKGGRVDDLINQYRCPETSFNICSEVEMFSTTPTSKWREKELKVLDECDPYEAEIWQAETRQIIDNVKETMEALPKLCSYKLNPKKVPYAKSISQKDTSIESRLETLNDLLNKKKAIVISHSLLSLYSGDALKEREIDHSTTVVGRELIIGPQGCRIEYMLRDSSSSNCHAYKNSDKRHVRCEMTDKGPTVWVSKEWMQANMKHLTYLEKRAIGRDECK